MEGCSLEPDLVMPVCFPDLTALLVPVRTLRPLVCLALSPVGVGKGAPGCHVCPPLMLSPEQLAGCLEKGRGRVVSDFLWLPIGSLAMEYSVTIRHSLGVVVKLQR